MRRRQWFTALSLLLLSACGTQAAEVNFTLPDVRQVSHTLSDLRGRWVVINVWASWCPPCLREMPEFEAFYQRHKQTISVLGVNYEPSTAQDIQAFIKNKFGALSFPILLSNGQPFGGLTLRGMPTTFIVSPKGELVNTHLGELTAAQLELKLQDLGASLSAP